MSFESSGHPLATTKERPTPLGFFDPRTVDGELLWPEVYTPEKVANMEVNMGIYAAAGQLQQRPAPRGGGMFRREWFAVTPTVPHLRRVVAYVDKAGTKEGTGAETAITLIGEYEDAGADLLAMKFKYIILECIHGRWEAAEREAIIKNTAQTWEAQYGFVEWWVEEEPGSGGKESAQSTIANLVGFSCKAEKVTGDKATRAEPLASQASVGKIKMKAAAWNNYVLDELEVFPVGKLRDIPDSLGGAFNKLWQPGGGIGSADEFRTG
jgi:predicted phage terminase large subunit-like protein